MPSTTSEKSSALAGIFPGLVAHRCHVPGFVVRFPDLGRVDHRYRRWRQFRSPDRRGPPPKSQLILLLVLGAAMAGARSHVGIADRQADSGRIRRHWARRHWAPENAVHHVRDVTQGEDAPRVRPVTGPR
jgi:hypothetical protein